MSNFRKQADGSYIEAGVIGDIGAKVVDDTEDFGISSTAAPPEVEIPWAYVLAAVGGVIAIIGVVVLIRR